MKRIHYVLVLGILLQVASPHAEEATAIEHGKVDQTTSPQHGVTEGAPVKSEGNSAEPEIKPPVWPSVLSDIRALYAMQDAAAAGHQEATSLQGALLQQISRKLANENPNVEPNILASGVVGFVLSGGNPMAAERLASQESISRLHRKLLLGASFYMRGKRKEASEELAGIDVFALKPSVAGRVALVKAMLETSDGVRQQQLLSIAIALMPGSLIEESALRRSALIYARAGRQREFWQRADRYIRRFSRSLYARDFLFDVIGEVLNWETSGRMPDLQHFDLLLGTIRVSDRRNLYLHLARQATRANLVGLTEFASHRLLRLSAVGSREAQLAQLYDSIFDVASGNSERAAAVLMALDPLALPSLEQKLRSASLAVVGQIQDKVGAVEADFEPSSGTGETSELLRTAKAELERADGVISATLQ